MSTDDVSGEVAGEVVVPATREGCQARTAQLRDDIAAIKAQIAAADLDRQARGGRTDPRWFHRAKTALRHKQRELDLVSARLGTLAATQRDGFKDCLIEVLREDYDEAEWGEVLEEARRRQTARIAG